MPIRFTASGLALRPRRVGGHLLQKAKTQPRTPIAHFGFISGYIWKHVFFTTTLLVLTGAARLDPD